MRDGSELQTLLAALLDLELSVKHAHWNCYGAGFRDLHLHMQDLAEAVGSKADAVAEHALARGVSPDGRAASIAAGSALPVLPPGPILVEVAIAAVAGVIDSMIELCQQQLETLAGTDVVGDDLVVSIVALLEHHRWMLIAEFSSTPPAVPPPSMR